MATVYLDKRIRGGRIPSQSLSYVDGPTASGDIQSAID